MVQGSGFQVLIVAALTFSLNSSSLMWFDVLILSYKANTFMQQTSVTVYRISVEQLLIASATAPIASIQLLVQPRWLARLVEGSDQGSDPLDWSPSKVDR